uniref:Si:ch211-247i17.1 n=1 Tax=Poecilia reticulata TaxID=8081 RepID=A0A3P9P533_POERE
MKTLILNSITITLQLWDTAGQERYRSITEQYYRKADGILAMYDVTHSASFSAVRGWMDSVRVRGRTSKLQHDWSTGLFGLKATRGPKTAHSGSSSK